MTDNQDPLQVLQKLIKSKENLPATPAVPEVNQEQNVRQASQEEKIAVAAGQLTPEQQVVQQVANAAKEAKLQAQLEEHEKQQAIKDQQAIENLRTTELSKVVPTDLNEEEIPVSGTQDLTQKSADGKVTQQQVHEVEQLKRLD